MMKLYSKSLRTYILAFFFIGMLLNDLNAQINFNQSNLDLNGTTTFSGVTAMEFGPDGKLYVAEYKSGFVKVLTVQKNTANDYVVTNVEALNGIRTMADHNDDGSVHNAVQRQITGLTVAGTATSPIIYVASSDIRIGAGTGGGNGDSGLDTNSGVITRFTKIGNSYVVVDLVRGLPRSEENHATNGLQLTVKGGTNYLLVASGGFTNGGAPSTNFVYACEYALSGAILSVDLDALDLLPVLSDGGRSYIHDLPTLDDPTRANVNGITDPDNPSYDGVDVNDPFGGNDGLNQAIVEIGGPVQIFSPGYRNAYDLVVTESGAVYVTDNGANDTWGGFPVNEGTPNVTNDYDPSEPGSGSASGGEQINNEDHLQLVTTDIQNYTFGTYYGGHPNPTRANPDGAGLYTAPDTNGNANAIFRTQIYDPDGSTLGSTTNPNIALPANWPPVQTANPDEGDWRGPGIPNPDGPVDGEVTIWNTNTNPLVEYTAENFGGVLKGNLLAGDDAGNIRRVQLNANGMLSSLDQTFLSGVAGGGLILGLTANGENQVFPGTIWAGTFDGDIVVIEPGDAINCIAFGEPGYDANADYDNDGYTNQDEEDNGTDPCNGGSQPSDFDKSVGSPFISDLNDTDDDADGIADALDPFQLGDPDAGGSDAFSLPVSNAFVNFQQGLGGIFGLGLTGLMNNSDTGANWLDWIDVEGGGPNPDDVLGGAPGEMISQMGSGTALGNANSQEKAYQYGVQTSTTTGLFTVFGNLIDIGVPLGLYNNTAAVNPELGHFIGDGTQSNYIKVVLTVDGITALQEINDIPQTPITVPISVANRPTGSIVFYFVVDPSNGQVDLEYSSDGGPRTFIGTIMAQGNVLTAIQQTNQDLAVGLIGTSGAAGVELQGTWDFLNVFGEVPSINQIPNITRAINASNESIDLNQYFNDDNGTNNLTYTVFQNSNSAIGASISGDDLDLTFPAAPAVTTITIRATDEDSFSVDNTFTVTVTDGPVVLYRINSGGPQLTAIDGGIDWEADTNMANSQFLSIAGTNEVFPSTNIPVDGSVDTATTPLAVFASERYDGAGGTPNMTYSFPAVQSGNYEVRLYMANSFSGTNQPGDRIFDVAIEGVVLPLLNDIDLVDAYGDQTGTVISHILNVTDGTLDVSFLHGAVENPLINAIEILDASEDDTPIYVNPIADQFSNPGEQLNGSLGVNAFGGDGNLTYSATGFPAGVVIEPTNGQIGGTIGAATAAGSPYNVTINVNDSDGTTSDISSISFVWNVGSDVWVDKNENENYTARHECSAVQAGDKFYLMGGRGNENPTTIDVYDYATDTWQNLTNSVPSEFNHFQAVEYQGLIWVIGAFTTNNYPNEVPEEFIWAFNPATEEWIQGPQIPAGRRRGAAGLAVYNDKFYILAGNTQGHNGGYVAWFDEYDPATGVWTQLADAPRERDHFHSTIIGTKLYAAGGRLSDDSSASVFKPVIPEVDVYDFVTATWSTLPAAQNIPTPRGGASSVTFNNKLVVIGGEVQNELVYGVNTSDALKITEEYDPVTETWTRLSDLNSERHGTQAIVSGTGIFVLAGSNQLGGGNQKNMEFLGNDNPVGVPSVASALLAPVNVIIADGSSETIQVNAANGNVGVIVSSMQISGPDAADFSIVSGELTDQLINVNSAHTLTVALAGTGANRSAILTVNYDNGESTTINLANFDNNLGITDPGTQNNNEGDAVSLQIQANGASTYTATNLPPTLTLDANTGLISGTISAGGANDGPFEEQGGLVIIEAESGDVIPTWITTTAGGATGILAGSTHLSTQNGATIPYEVTITTPGVYRFTWRSFFSGPDPTEENDNWVKFPNNNNVWYFGFKGTPADEASLIANVQSATPTNIVFPKGSNRVTPETTPEGNGSNGYFKIFRSGGSTEVYDWQAKTSDNDSHDIYVYFVNPGTYPMEISERSAGHAIDKIALYKLDGTNYTDGQLTAAPESNRSSGIGAADGSPYTVTVSVADNGAPPSTANAQFTWYVGETGDPIAEATATPMSGFAPLEVNFTGSNSTDDVGVTTYLWNFNDGSSMVTTSNPTHTFTNPGTYEVELTVGDGDGNTSLTTVTVTVSDPATAGDVRLNSGGPAYTFGGVDWAADQYFTGGKVFSDPISIENTNNDLLYQTERYSDAGPLTYEIPVAAGSYHLNLHFVELYFGLPGLGVNGGVGSRVFNINVENGQVQINNYDIVIAAGGSGVAIIENFKDIDVTDGSLTITLTGVTENPKLSGIELIVPGGNIAPEAYAGDDDSVSVPNSYTLDGSATDPDGGAIVSYAWTQVNGPSQATFSSATEENPTVSDLEGGTYIFMLTATDDEGQTGSDTVTITVISEPSTLLINSGGPAYTFGNEDWSADIHFVGGGIFPTVPDPVAIENTDNDELYQSERFSSAGTLVYEIPVDAAGDYNVDLHFAELYFGAPGLGSAGGPGSRVFNINIEDGQVLVNNYDIFVESGGSLTAIVESYKSITVNDGSLTITLTSVVENPKISGIGVFETRAPMVDAGEDEMLVLPINSFTLNGSATDPDGGAINSYQWTQESGPNTATLVGATTPDLDASDLIAGAYVFRLTATDDEGVTGFDEVTVTVSPEGGNQAPIAVASATPLTGDAPLEVLFTGSDSTDDVAIVTYAWDFKDGMTSSEADPTHTFTAAGTYEVELTVTDAGGLTDTAAISITVTMAGNQAPNAVAQATPNTGDSPLEVTFTGSNSTDDEGIVTYAWDFMDGNTSAEADPVHTFTVDGTYGVVLTVTDAGGLTDTTTVSIVVGDSDNMPPIAVIEAEPASGAAPLEVNFIGTGSSDDFGIVSYLWTFGDGATSTEVNPTHTYIERGVYTVSLEVTDAGGLTSTETIEVVATGDTGEKMSLALEFNPPQNGTANLRILNVPENATITSIDIFDVGGRHINGWPGNDSSINVGGIYPYALPVAYFKDGLYIISVSLDEKKPVLYKMLIQN